MNILKEFKMKKLFSVLIALFTLQAEAGPSPAASVLETQRNLPAGTYTVAGKEPCSLNVAYTRGPKGELVVRAKIKKQTRFGISKMSVVISSDSKETVLEKVRGNYQLSTSKNVISNEIEEVDRFQILDFDKENGKVTQVALQIALVNNHSDPS